MSPAPAGLPLAPGLMAACRAAAADVLVQRSDGLAPARVRSPDPRWQAIHACRAEDQDPTGHSAACVPFRHGTRRAPIMSRHAMQISHDRSVTRSLRVCGRCCVLVTRGRSGASIPAARTRNDLSQHGGQARSPLREAGCRRRPPGSQYRDLRGVGLRDPGSAHGTAALSCPRPGGMRCQRSQIPVATAHAASTMHAAAARAITAGCGGLRCTGISFWQEPAYTHADRPDAPP